MKNILLSEYNTLKSEQLARIKTRDNLIYISLSIFGAIFSYAMSEKGDHTIALLVLPMLSFVLAWTYIVNDEKISQIGKYIRKELACKLKEYAEESGEGIFGWEPYHRLDNGRASRKILQTAVDLMAFALPSIISIVIYYCRLTTNILELDSVVIMLFVWGLAVTLLTSYLLIFYDFPERFNDSRKIWQALFWITVLCTLSTVGLYC